MIIALACEGDRISPRFCRASEFTIFEVEFGKIGSPAVEAPGGEGPAAFCATAALTW